MTPLREGRLVEAIEGVNSKLGVLVEGYLTERQVIAEQFGEMQREINLLRTLVRDGVAMATAAQRVEWKRERDEWIDRAMAAVQS